MTNTTLALLNSGFAVFVASLHLFPGPLVLEPVHPDPSSTPSYLAILGSSPTESDRTVTRARLSRESEVAPNTGATGLISSSGRSDFVGAVTDAGKAITALDGEVGSDAGMQWFCVGWERIILYDCWWWCPRPNYFCPCVECTYYP